MKKIIGNTLFLLSIFVLPFSFALSSTFGESDIFGIGGIVRYSWIMLLFIPVEILSFVYGFYLKNKKLKYKKNCIVVYICLPILIIFGSYRFLFPLDYSTKPVETVEEKTDIDLPDNIKLCTIDYEDYIESRVKINDENDRQLMLEKIKISPKWVSLMSTKIKNSLPSIIQPELDLFDYFMFYNETDQEFNKYPEDFKEYNCVFIAYDSKSGVLLILNECIIKT